MSFWSGRKVLVTGAGGFIGSHLCEALVEAGCRVRAMVRYSSRVDLGNLDHLPPDRLEEIEVVRGDVADPWFVRRAVEGCGHVFHLAALIGIPYSYRSPAHYVQVNVHGALAVLEACRAAGVDRLVHTSTSEAYGTARYVPIDEAHPLQGQSPYSATKIAADKLAESYHLSFGLPVATIRPFNTYGPRQSPRAFIPTAASQILAGRSEIELGRLDPVRDLMHVEDTCRAFLVAGEDPAWVGRVTNAGTGEGFAVGEVAERLVALSGREAEVVSKGDRARPEASEVMRLVCDATLARASGWAPRIGLDEGLGSVLDFVGAHPDLYRPDEYSV